MHGNISKMVETEDWVIYIKREVKLMGWSSLSTFGRQAQWKAVDEEECAVLLFKEDFGMRM